jgi:BirA family biotin operon repressor/biotin-[acetyl-CoA-carboxylase] ligase
LGVLTTDGEVDPVGLRAVQHLLEDGVCAAADYQYETLSTNTSALSDLRADGVAPGEFPKIYLADSQTAGRGRHGRRWVSDAGTLTFSLVVDRLSQNQATTKLLSLAVGVGVARGIEFEFAPLKAKLKWPNDVQIGGGKVAGILLETTQHAARSVVAGVGINVGQSPDLGEDPAAGSVRSIAEVIGREVHRYELLAPVVGSILGAIADLDQCAGDLVEEFRERCVLTGQRVRFQQGETTSQGECKGVTVEGDLIVETDSGLRHLQSGEAILVRKSGVRGGIDGL